MIQRFLPSPEPCGRFRPGDLRLDDPAGGAGSGRRASGRRDRRRASAGGDADGGGSRARVGSRPPAGSLGDVVAVGAGERDGERCAAAAGDQVVLGAAPGAVDRARAGLFAPPNARTCELSIAPRDQSIRSASLSFASSSLVQPPTSASSASTGSLPLGGDAAGAVRLRSAARALLSPSSGDERGQ
jgi:hypothetical protein